MDTQRAGEVEREHGRVEAFAPRPAGPARPGVVLTRHEWRPPPYALAGSGLLDDFRVALDGSLASEGVRWFWPAESPVGLIVGVSNVGPALLAARGEIGPGRQYRYHASRLAFMMSDKFKEFLNRRFTRESDLYTPAGGGDRTILPDRLGLGPSGSGRPWSASELLERGRAAGAQTTEAAIRLGLVEAARLDPLDPAAMTEAEVAAVVRMALFDFGPCREPLAPERARGIRLLLHRAARKDQQRDPRLGIWSWAFSDLDNLTRRISKTKVSHFQFSRPEVRQVLLDLAFESYCHTGAYVHAAMQSFAAALPDPLTPRERATFDAVYAKQRYLAGMPLFVLIVRLSWLRDAVYDLLSSPGDPRHAGVILRMLDYYGTMARRRREADSAKNRTKSSAAGLTAPPESGSIQHDLRIDEDPFQEIAAELREQRGASCDCGTTARWRASFAGADPLQDPIEIHDGCERGDCFQVVNVLQAVFLAAARACE